MEHVLRRARWAGLVTAALVAPGCANSEHFARYLPEERPPGQFAPTTRELTARKIAVGTLDVISDLVDGCGR